MELAIQALIAPVILSLACVVLMMQIAFWRNPLSSWLITCISLLIAMVACFSLLGSEPTALLSITLADSAISLPQQITPLLVADQYSVFYSVLILFASLITTLLAKDYLQDRKGENEEFYLLLMLSALGGLILVSATHLASFLLGLELLGVAIYALIAYPERGHLPLEGAIKYLILSGAASAILLFGFALIYAALGTLSFEGIGNQLSNPQLNGNQLIILMGTAMVMAGIAFKLSLVPFHMWTPDVYHGAPVPVSGFLATVSKGAIFAALMRLFVDAKLYQYESFLLGLSVMAIASMLIGNLLALKQENLKRLLAYSSIAHLGYLIITLVVFGVLQQADLAVEAATFYLAAYVVTSLAAFAVLTILSDGKHISQSSSFSSRLDRENVELDHIDHIRGLFWRQPLLALTLTVAMLSLAGIPLTVGFIGKFYLFTTGIQGSLWLLLGALVIGSAISIYYYLRIIFAMTMKNDEQTNESPLTLSPVATLVALVLVALTLYLGVLPQSLMEYLGSLSL